MRRSGRCKQAGRGRREGSGDDSGLAFVEYRK